MTFTWQGRRLATASANGKLLSFKYNSDGIRTQKTVNGVTTYFTLDGSKIISQKKGNQEIFFEYDAQGNLATMIYNGETFYYVRNLTGEIMGLTDSSGNMIVEYLYDPWGKLIDYSNTGNFDLANLNPFKYKDYYYDSELGLYYLNSRYYDPEICRFINADGQLNDDILGCNMFAYCSNNPINRVDPNGTAWWHWALGAAVVVACAAATVVTCGGFAAAAGAVAAVGCGVAASSTAATIAAGAFIGSATAYGLAVVDAVATSNSIQEFNDKGNWGTVANTASAGISGGVGAYVSTRTPTKKVYRSVSAAEAEDIKLTGQFNLAPGGMESKQFGLNLAETRQFGNKVGQDIIVSAKLPKNMISQFCDQNVDTNIFRHGTLTVYGDQLDVFNQAVRGTIKIMH